MKHEPPHPHADLWTRARELLAAFTHAWGAARKIALQWTMFDEHLVEALKALAPIEALARRLVLAEALTVKLKPSAPRRIVRKVKRTSPFTFITLDPLAFRRSLESQPIFHLRPPHPLEKPAEDWRVRFCVARFAEVRRADEAKRNPPRLARDTNNGGLRSAPSALREFSSRGDPIKIAASRRERRALARAAKEQAWYDYWYGDPDAPRKTAEPVYTWRVPARVSTAMLARRTEALRRVIDAPSRYARALARRIAKHVVQVTRIVRRLRRRTNDLCQQAMHRIDAALPAFADTS